MRDLIESYDFVSPLEEVRDIIVQFASANPWITTLGILTLLFFFLWRRNLKIRRKLQKTSAALYVKLNNKIHSPKKPNKEVCYEKSVKFDGDKDSKNAYLTAVFTFKSQVPLDDIVAILQNSLHFLCGNSEDGKLGERTILITEYVKRYNTNVEVLLLNEGTNEIKFIFHAIYKCSNPDFYDCDEFDAVKNDAEFIASQLETLVEGLAQNMDDNPETQKTTGHVGEVGDPLHTFAEKKTTSRCPPKPPASGGGPISEE